MSRRRGGLGVVEEQFEEIAHPVEQQRVAGLGLEAVVLRHHRGLGRRSRAIGAVVVAKRAPCEGDARETAAKARRTRSSMSESNVKFTEAEALDFHSRGRPGKIEIIASKPMATQRDLSLAYSPGVAVPVRRSPPIPACAYDYTAKGNLVAVISNGTAILGLGNLGALASKPVMEGKAVLFKRFADVDSIDIESTPRTRSASSTRRAARAELRRDQPRGHRRARLLHHRADAARADEHPGVPRRPARHRDHHRRRPDQRLPPDRPRARRHRVVVNGAGAAAIACTELIKAMGVRGDHVIMCDRKGVIHKGRTDLDQWKSAHAVETEARTLAEALVGADVFLGLSAAGALKPDMVKTMAPRSRSSSPWPIPTPRSRPRPRRRARRDHRHRPLGLSQPGQQRARLPVHLPRRARRARDRRSTTR
jgi:malate dehydrogenase (oxaloacetate-decarboxylating)(NADP+)